MRNARPIWIVSVLILSITLACAGSLAPTEPPDTIATIIAATMAAVTPATPQPSAAPSLVVPTLLLPTTAPTQASIPPTPQPVSPTLALPAATRITFLPDATTGVVNGTVDAGQAVNYVLQASQGQIMMVNVDSTNHDVTISIKTQGGTSMLNASAHQATWQQALPQTEDYYITVHGGATTENFTLSVTIPSRIKFAEGADKATVSGKTAGGYNVLYTVFAIKGQKMSVNLSNLSGDAALTIYGYTDGTPYVRYVSEQTSFSFDLPSTQDYIIEVVPKAGSVVSYAMVVKIE
jgi:hypothetical protein